VHRSDGFVVPDEFIPLAERSGLIGALTAHVLRQAIRQCRSWLDVGLEVPVAVNLSTRSLLDPQLPAEVKRFLDENELSTSFLTLEVTESGVMSDPVRTLAVLQRLDAMGVTISVDDFGTGYSSLSYLKRLPVREVKIDKSFVQTMTREANDAMIVRSIIDLGQNLGLEVVAEGVESQATWDELAVLGCDVLQGYFLRRPGSAEEVDAWLTERRPATV
jgi:EAL domain-containing protein (putative c-di-GMP-specific phosphodiesterase class I)